MMKPTNRGNTMKNRIIACILSVMCSAGALAQTNTASKRIDVTLPNATLKELFAVIEKKSNFRFLYDATDIDVNKPVSAHYTNTNIDQILKEQLVDMTYEVKGNQIVVKSKSKSEKQQSQKQQPANITGMVTDHTGEPLPGVNIVEKGTTNGVITDPDGKYSIKVTNDASVLLFSYIGYASAERPVSNKTKIDVVLDEDTQQIEEVVVIGYGTESKAGLSTSVAQIKAKEFDKIAYSDPGQAMAGRMPGVYVKQASGAPGNEAQISIRGVGSITSGNSPLLVIDGLPVADGVGLSSINPNDIESIDILKDVASASVYGSRAANGVILITTKKGEQGKAKYFFNTYYGVQKVERKYDLVNAYEQAELMAEGRTYKGNVIPNFIKPYLEGQQGLTDTDWQDHIFRSAPVNYYELSVSGANDLMNYYVSGNYFKQEGIVVGTDFQRYSARINMTTKLTDKLEFGMNLNPSYTIQDRIDEGWDDSPLSMGIYNSYPFFPIYNDDGSYAISNQINAVRNYTGMAEAENYVAVANSTTNKVNYFKMLGGAHLAYKPIEGLTFKAYIGGYFLSRRTSYYRPSYLGAYRQPAPTVASARSGSNDAINWISENTVTYRKQWDRHAVDLLGGFSYQQENGNANSIYAENFPNDEIETINYALKINSASSTMQKWALSSFFARAKYDYAKRYFLTVSLRLDGSSRFGENNPYGMFPAISGSWRISEEAFFPKNNIITELKPRVSWGISGNDAIGNYSAMALMNNANYNFNGNIAGGMYPSTAPNTNLSWEKNQTTNLGLDLSFWKGKGTVTFDYYISKTRDMLLEVPVPAYSGYEKSLQNVGRMENKGIEVSISYKDNIGDFGYQVSANFTRNRNKVLELGPNQTEIVNTRNITRVGHPIGELYGYRIVGIFENEEQLKTKPNYRGNQLVGDYMFADLDNDGAITANDREALGSAHPDFLYGGNIQLFYKGLDLGLTIQGVQGVNVFSRDISTTILNNEVWSVMHYEYYKNRWISPEKPGKYAKAGSNTNTLCRESDFYMQDASFFKIRDISLGYTFNNKLFSGTTISNLRVYMSMKNPFIHTPYMGLNPESNTGSDPLNLGVTLGQYPSEKNFTAGVSINF